MRGSFVKLSLLALIGLLMLVPLACGGTETEGGAEKTAKVGEAVSVGGVKYTVTGVNKAKTVGPETNKYTAEQGTFVVVDVTVENVGKESAEFDGDMAKLWDSEDQAYELHLEASGAAASQAGIADVVNIWFGSLEAGKTVKSKAVFDVPEDAKELRIEVRSPEIGSEDKAFISLGI